LSFRNPRTQVAGAGTVYDEDVVRLRGSVGRLYFVGAELGLAGARSRNLDAFSLAASAG
jgi:hypothetical protein